MFDIAVIGAGATAISLLKHLEDIYYNNNFKKPKVALIGPDTYFGQGRAFGDTDGRHRVNTPPGMLAISEYEPNNFSKFLVRTTGSHVLYPVRQCFADYLSETLAGIRQRKIIQINEYKTECQDIAAVNNSFALDIGGEQLQSVKAVLCLGSLNSTVFPEYQKLSQFHMHHHGLAKIENSSVIIAGTGLTAIDMFRTLDRKKNNRICMYSRHGYLPTCLSSASTYNPEYVDWNYILNHFPNGITAKEFFQLLVRENNVIGSASEYTQAIKKLGTGGPQAFFAFLQAKASAGDTPFQDMLVSTRPYMHRLWRSFSAEDRRWFLAAYGARWTAWGYPVPDEIMSELREAVENGRLQFLASVNKPAYGQGKFSIEDKHMNCVKADYLVDGTGGSNNILLSTSVLMRNLLKSRLIKADTNGGIAVNPLSFRCLNPHMPHQHLYNIGPLNKGALFSSNAFCFNSRWSYLWARNEYMIETEGLNT